MRANPHVVTWLPIGHAMRPSARGGRVSGVIAL